VAAGVVEQVGEQARKFRFVAQNAQGRVGHVERDGRRAVAIYGG
jgi:hypothetical protein